MGNASRFDYAFDNPANGFESIYDDSGSEQKNTLHRGQTLSDLRPAGASGDGSPGPEQKTIYVQDTDGTPPELDELNEAVEDDWEITDMSLAQKESTQDYYFVVTLEREAPRSFFEVATSYSDPSLGSETT